MEFQLLLTNPRKRWWLWLYVAGWASLGGATGLFFDTWGDALTRLSPVVDAGLKLLALVLLGVTFYWFERLQAAIREPVRVTIWPDGLAAFYQQSGRAEAWTFAQLQAYTYQSHSRFGTFLKLSVREGTNIKWQTGNFGFNYQNTDAFAAMAQAFEITWVRYQQASKSDPIK